MIVNAPFDKNNPKSYRISTVKAENGISVLEIGHNTVPGGLKQVMKRNVYIIHYITNGKGVFLGEDFDDESIYLVTPCELEIVISDEKSPYEASWIMFEGVAAKEILKKCGFSDCSGVYKFDKNRQCAEIIKNNLYNINPQNEFEESFVLQSVFYQLMAVHMSDIKEFTEAPSFTAQKVKNFIDNNYHRRISVESLAKENNYTRNYLCTLFKNEYGISPKEYMTALRIEKAKNLLLNNLSVTEVSSAVGFNDCLYFSRLFHKKTGFSPTEYKKRR